MPDFLFDIGCDSFAYSVLRRFLPEEKVESIKGLALTADGKGAVFDVASDDLDLFLKGIIHFYLFLKKNLVFVNILTFIIIFCDKSSLFQCSCENFYYRE